jgi:GT2 family glycosyltransferase
LKKLSIIIVNYKTAKLIVQLLHSIQRLNEYEVIVVDNDSKDDSKSVICSAFPNISWIAMSYNAGFARANNEGIRKSSADVVLLLNPDTLEHENAIGKCLEQFQSDNYVACGVQLLNPDGSPQISGNYAMKGGLNYLLPLPYTGAFVKWLGSVLKVSKPNIPNATATIEVDWINGAYLMVKKTAIEKAGLLDEDFFLYAEEAEWCSRLKKQGMLCIYGEYKVTHLQGEAANDAFNSEGKGYYNLYDKKGLQIMLSNFLRIKKQFGAFWFFVDLIMYTITIPIFLIIGFFHRLITLQNPIGHLNQFAGYSSNIISLWGYVPRMLSGKPYFYKVL